LCVVIEVCFQKIGEKENLQNYKHDKELHQDNDPNLTAPITHVFESAEIERQDSQKDVLTFHLGFFLCLKIVDKSYQ